MKAIFAAADSTLLWSLLGLNVLGVVLGLIVALVVLQERKRARAAAAPAPAPAPTRLEELIEILRGQLESWIGQLQAQIKDLKGDVASAKTSLETQFVRRSSPGRSSTSAPSSDTTSGPALDVVLQQNTEQFKRFVENACDSLRAELQGVREMSASAPPTGAKEQKPPPAEGALATMAWPPFFRDGPLAAWRERIEAGMARREASAFDMFLAVARFNSVARDPSDRRRLAEALYSVSVEGYRYWKANGVGLLDAVLEWRGAFQGYLDSAGLALDIILALPKDRFDMNSMLSAEAGSGARMFVKEAFSWIVRDKSAEVPKVLHHARVLTC